MSHVRPLPIVQTVLLFLCIGTILTALTNSNTAEVRLGDKVYAEIGPAFSKVHHNEKIITVYLSDYSLPGNSTEGKWGGPWYASTDFHTYMILAVTTLTTAAICSIIEIAVILHRMLHPSRENLSNTPAVVMCGVSIMMLIVAVIGMQSTVNLKLAGLKTTASWGMAGAPVAIGFQVVVGILLLCC